MRSSDVSSAIRGPEEQRLAEALRQEAERVTPAPEALALIQRRVATGPPAPRLAPAHRRATVAVAGALALAAAVSVVVGLGLRTSADPTPVEHPTAAPTYGVDPPRSQVDIYRVRLRAGSPVLSVEAVSTSEPFQPRAALDALLGTAPLAAADNSALNNGRNVVDSTSETMDALVIDLSAADQTTRPDTPALAQAWLQAWVHTTQSAYHSELPVLIRLHGQPFTLYGVDTTRPITATHLPEVRDVGIQMPRPGQSLVSPVQLAANLPSGDYQWKVVDTRGKTVFSDGVSGSAGYGTFKADLQPGSYRAVVSGRSEPAARAFRREVSFVVTGPATEPAVDPVTDPSTTPLDAVAVYWATPDGRFVRELRVRRDPAEMLTDYFMLPAASDEAARLQTGNRVRSVTVTADAVVVDFSQLQSGPIDRPTDLPGHQAEAFGATVRSIVGGQLPIRFTRDGKQVLFLGYGALPDALPAKLTDSDPAPYPQPVHESGRAEIVGVTKNPGAPTTYVLYDAVTHEARFQGTVPGVDPRTRRYAFALAAPSGRYLLEVHNTDVHEQGWLSEADLTVG